MPTPASETGIMRDPRLPPLPKAQDTAKLFPAYVEVLKQQGLTSEADVVADAFTHVKANRRGKTWNTGRTLGRLILDYRTGGDRAAATVLGDLLTKLIAENYTRLTDKHLIARLRATTLKAAADAPNDSDDGPPDPGENHGLELPADGSVFVLTWGKVRPDQVYGRTYSYSSRASGDSRKLTTALQAWRQGGPPVSVIVYRPGPTYAFTAWARVTHVVEPPPDQRPEAARRVLELEWHEFPVPLNLKGNAVELCKDIDWLAGGLVKAFNYRAIRLIPATDAFRILTAARALADGQDVDEEPNALPEDTFTVLRRSLAAKGLHFPDELVSNYLLALQTKRFVILTGLSGTGKTQLALAVAQYFQPLVQTETPVHVPEGAFIHEVDPYMLNYHRMQIPASMQAILRLPPLEPGRTSGLIEVDYPEGRTKLRFNKAPDRPVMTLLFRGAFRTWFETHLRVGDRFMIQIDATDDTESDRLRFALLRTEVLKRPLDNVRVVAVRPDWTDNRALLGYYNPLLGRYEKTPVLELLLRAQAECDQARAEGRTPHPFFLILDEMNLAHVEHYFSDFLSCLESGQELELHQDERVAAGETEDGVAIPPRLPIPPNVFFTGTVNIDETTYMFSPKVLDRAFTIEFNQVDLAGYSRANEDTGVVAQSPIILHHFRGLVGAYCRPSQRDWLAFIEISDELQQLIIELNELLAEEGRHFGYRVANEMARFVWLAYQQGEPGSSTWQIALDLAIMQKVLPKFHGTQQELEALLMRLFGFAIMGKVPDGATDLHCDDRQWRVRQGLLVPAEGADGLPDRPRLLRTGAKLWRMLRRLRQQGFTSFIE